VDAASLDYKQRLQALFFPEAIVPETQAQLATSA